MKKSWTVDRSQSTANFLTHQILISLVVGAKAEKHHRKNKKLIGWIMVKKLLMLVFLLLPGIAMVVVAIMVRSRHDGVNLFVL